MTLKNFLNKNNISALEIADNTIISVISEGTTYGLDVDTCNITAGNYVNIVDVFEIRNDILIVDDIKLDTNMVHILNTKY
jgi:hypothetical protein